MITNKSELNTITPTLYITLDPLSIGIFFLIKAPYTDTQTHKHTYIHTQI